jgi:uncharacterized protein (TIGR03382 family)
VNARLALLLLSLGSTVAMADPSGKQWGLATCGSCPQGQACVNARCAPQFRIAASVDNTGGTSVNGGLAYSTVVNRTIAAFAAWTAGRVGCNTSWRTVNVAAYSTPAGVQAINATDRFNNVIWLSGTSWRHLQNELALTTTTYLTSNNEIIDADMEMNNNLRWSDNLTANTYDAESVILHEAGHFAGLNHIGNASTAVMYPFVSIATSKRVLTSLDETDICTVYPGVSGTQGTSCTSETCQSGLVCRGRQGSTTKICTTSCTSNSSCQTGSTCQAATTGMACLPQVGAPDLCKFCQTGGECSSGLCLRFLSGPSEGQTFCSMSCSDSSQCGPNYTCDMTDGICVPNASTCTNQCTSATQCAAGYTCTGGTCVPRGDPGDPCGVSFKCDACNVCTRDSANSADAYCRPCCGNGGSGTALCAGCSATTCTTGNVCTALQGDPSSVCLPGSALPTSCQTCNNGMCAQGLTCVGGRCRAPCNPSSPGSCVACLQSGSDTVCACSDELSTEGEPCGQLGATTFAACNSGLACVGSTNLTCRARCDVNVSGSCRTGQSCQLMNGVAVCVPGSEGSTCANCTNTGQCNSGLTCYLGRCYQPCNVNVVNACATCVQSQADGMGICGCADQISPENGPCGTQPDVKSCQTGTRCINGSCRARCDPQVPSCPIFTDCASVGGDFYCVDQMTSGGGGGSGGGSGGGRTGGGSASTGGGAGGGGSTDLGCGCGPGGSPIGAFVMALVAVLRRRRAVSVTQQG